MVAACAATTPINLLMRALMHVFERRDFVFYSQLLPLPVGDESQIGQGAMGFGVDGFLQAAVTRPEGLDAIVSRHGSS
jgi:hypothetical protein